ncbi:hypothetical protein IRJ41_019503, partial [Triplophysa rosa]
AGQRGQHIYNPVTTHHEEHLLNAKAPSAGLRTTLLLSFLVAPLKDTFNKHTHTHIHSTVANRRL